MVDVAESQYMFVEYAATTRPSQGEKRRRGGPTEVRSHITKAFHRRTKITRLEASTRVPATPELKPQTSTGAAKGDDDAAQIGRSLSSDKDAKTGVARNRCSSKDGSVQYYTDQQSNTVLRDGGFNAFDLLTGQRMPQYIHLVLDHFKVPGLNVPCSVLLFHAFIYATTLHLLSASNGRELIQSGPLIRLSHKTETIKLVNQQLRSLDGPASDALIMAVAILAIHGSRDETVHPEVHPPSPLASAQNVHVYGNMINDEQHTQAILVLIEQKGGLESLELFGMADIMALHVLDSRAIELDSELGTGFRYFRSNSTGYELLEVLESFSEVTNALDHYARGGSAAPELVDLIEARNASQHRLLSLLPKRVDLTDAEVCVQQATRLATMIFSDMVLFPLPPTQRMRPKLARELVDILEACTLLRCWDVHGQVLVWILTLGTVAASFTPERTWYVEQLSYRLSVMSIDDLPELESICSKFLWWQPICGGPVQTLWYEVQLEFQAAESLPD
ncbi:hypothetical protein LTR10_020649 [Elasticomyces elasticus]|nr:hypothetical protein LTR10_020649 [Elasticomyces elasticus]KAK5029999.1 hypothetical protein LTS07_005723 [Exophiala sideris]